jgi:putative transposase
MANTYTQITIQIVFAVKNRENIIRKSFREELYKYMAGIIKNKEQKLLSINGVSDHVHILVGIEPSISISDLVRDIKNNSSRFINEQKWIPGKFQWQEGYGAFSYSKSQRNTVISYIENQESHHKKASFKEEYLCLLEDFEINFDNKYLFEF